MTAPYVVETNEYLGTIFAEIDALGPEVLDLLTEGGMGVAGPVGPQGPVGATGPAGPAYVPADGSIALAKLSMDPLARVNHTGTQLAASISNFDTQVRTSRLDQMTAPTAIVAAQQGINLKSSSARLESELPTAYPNGVSTASVISSNGWPFGGVLLTICQESAYTYCSQVLMNNAAQFTARRSSIDGVTWTAWAYLVDTETSVTINGTKTFSTAIQASAGIFLRVANGKLNADAPSTYPLGTSTATVTGNNGFPVNGVCLTNRHEAGVYTTQLLISQAATVDTYVRSSADNVNWTAWSKVWTNLDIARLRQFADAAAGWESIPRDNCQGSVNISATGGQRLRFFTADHVGTTTGVTIAVGVAQVGLTFTVAKIGLYTVAANGDLTLVASTAHDATMFNATGLFTKSWLASYAMVLGQRYAIGATLVYTGTGTTPAFGGATFDQVACAAAPRITGFLTGQADLPASATSASLGTTGSSHWFRLN